MLAGVAALGYGIGDFLGGHATRRIHVGSTLLWAHSVGLAAILAWMPLDGGHALVFDLLAGAAAGLFGLAGLAFLYSGLAQGRAAVVAPAAAVMGAVVPVVAGVLAGDALRGVAWVGVAAALPAILLLSTVEGSGRIAAGLGHGIAAGTFFGGNLVALAYASEASGMWPLAASRGLTAALLWGMALLFCRSWASLPLGSTAAAVTGVGLLDLVGNVGYLLAANMASLVVVAVVASLYPAVTVVAARLVHREDLSLRQVIGLLLALLSVVCFSL